MMNLFPFRQPRLDEGGFRTDTDRARVSRLDRL